MILITVAGIVVDVASYASAVQAQVRSNSADDDNNHHRGPSFGVLYSTLIGNVDGVAWMGLGGRVKSPVMLGTYSYVETLFTSCKAQEW